MGSLDDKEPRVVEVDVTTFDLTSEVRAHRAARPKILTVVDPFSRQILSYHIIWPDADGLAGRTK